ncbi:MAG: hypothetical protein ACI9HE_002072, partial [Planctomycetota bacterium]
RRCPHPLPKRRMKALFLSSLFAAACLAACSGEASHDHEHGEDHDHDHAADHAGDHAGEAESAGEHVHSAPHGGELIVLIAEGAHLELVHDAEEGELTGYFLGAHADTPLRLTQGTLTLAFPGEDGAPASFVLEAVANALTGETVGDTSEFHLQDPGLVGISVGSGFLGPIDVLGQTLEDLVYGD